MNPPLVPRGRGLPWLAPRCAGTSTRLAGIIALAAVLPLVACGAPLAPPITVTGRLVADAPAVQWILGILGQGVDAFGMPVAALGRGSAAVRLHLLGSSLSA